MYSLAKAHRGSALLVSLVILILLTIATTVFLERIWSFSQTSKWIETSNIAYYNALGLIEEQLIYTGVTKYQPWNIRNLSDTAGTSTGRSLIALTGSSIIPSAGEGNSPFDDDYNILTLGDPIQLVIPNGIIWNNVTFDFQIPRIGTATWANPANGGSGYILWTLGYTWASLFASGELNIFKWNDINNPTTQFGTFEWTTNSGTTNYSVNTFYTTADYLGAGGVNCTAFACTLKLSLIRPILLTDGRTLPFLQYKIDFWGGNIVPNQYMILESSSYSYGFFRSYTLRIPQITTNTALDFAILQ